MREWLTVIIILLIIGVLFDGWRRMRQSRRHSIKMSRTFQSNSEQADVDVFGSELPNGGARVVAKRGEDDTRQLTQQLQTKFVKSKTTLSSRITRIPEQVTLNLEEEVPVLMESISDSQKGRVEPTLSSIETEDEEENTSAVQEHAEGELDDEEHDDPLFAKTPPLAAQEADISNLNAVEDVPEPDDVDSEETELQQSEPQEIKPDEVLVINIMAGANGPFQGADLLEVILECGMRYGDMQIFHRYSEPTGEGHLYFSMANMVKPGTFDLNGMDSFETPGVSLFMTLPMPGNSVKAFNTMAMIAATIAERLGGDLKDETRSAMTNQTLEHCRQRIVEYERKRQLVTS